MSNMGYVRFENTLSDLRDCHEHMEDTLSASEHEARRRLVALCHEIAFNYLDGASEPGEDDGDF